MRRFSIISFVCVTYAVTGLAGCEKRNQDGGRKQEVLKNISNKNKFSIKDGCTLPLTWRGLWTTRYHGNNHANDSSTRQQQQQLNNSMNITQREVKPLGSCIVGWRKELYLIAHNNGRCFVCLSISQVHEKVLQVKQSSCIGDDKEAEEAPRRDNTRERRKNQERKINEELFKDLCLGLGAEERFLTFIRGDVTTHPCPLTSPHHFVYSSPHGNCFCRSPLSYLHHCSDATRLHFRLRKCKNCPETLEHEIDFVCLLRWESPQGETTIGYSLSDPEMIYHSFVTRRVDSIIYATMSPTSSNTTSIRNRVMEFTMQLTEDTFGWSPSSCSFPDWLGSFRWASFDNQLHLVFPSSETLNNSSPSSTHQLKSFKLVTKFLDSDWLDLKGSANEWLMFKNSIFKCLTISKSNQSQNGSGVTSRYTSSTSIMTQVLTNCSSAYRCIHLQRHKVDSITLFRLGEKKIHLDEEGCEDDKWAGGWMLLVNTHILPEHCPFTGQYVGHDVIVLPDMTSSNCMVILKSGCPDPSSISISSPCGHTSVLLECISWWSDEAKIFILTRNKFLPGVFQCYSFDPSNGEMLFQYEEFCQFAGHVIKQHQSYNLSFTFKYELEPCSVQDELASWSKSHPLQNNINNNNDKSNNNNDKSNDDDDENNTDHNSNKKQPQVTGNRIRENEMFPTSGHVSLISSHVMNDEKEWRGKNMRSPFLKERRPVVNGIHSALKCDVHRTCVILRTIATVAMFFVMTSEERMVAV